MIKITDKTECCGCNACVQVCPKHCISMQQDFEGFLYPVADESLCIDCGLCEKVCPVINQQDSIISEPSSYACINKDEKIRGKSSSGGIFSLLAKDVINDNGVVFGAKFDKDWNVVHDYTETIKGLEAFRGSKYVESNIGNNYIKAKEFLIQGRKVLFSGTPCQIAGLNLFLTNKYENLLTIDIVCHSIPSSKVWKMYLRELSNSKKMESQRITINEKINSIISFVSFRNKNNGWKDYSLKINRKETSEEKEEKNLILESKSKNSYMRGFLQDLYVRPSCSNCPARNYTSGSDIQIADFWGVEKYYQDRPLVNDNKGVSLALIITDKGQAIFNKIALKIYSFQIKYSEVEDHGLHSPLTSSTPPHKNRKKFYINLDKISLSKNIESCLREEERKKAIIFNIKKIAKFLGGRRVYHLLKTLK